MGHCGPDAAIIKRLAAMYDSFGPVDSEVGFDEYAPSSSSSRNGRRMTETAPSGDGSFRTESLATRRRNATLYVAVTTVAFCVMGLLLLVASGGRHRPPASSVSSTTNLALALKYKSTADIGYENAIVGTPTVAPTYSIAEIQVVQRIDYVTYAQAVADDFFKAAFIRGVISGGKIRQSELEYVGVADTIYGDAVEVTYNVRKSNMPMTELEATVRSSDITSAVKSYLVAAGFKDADTLQSAKTVNFSPSQMPTMHPTVAYAAIQATQRIDGITLNDVNGNVKFLTAIATGIADATETDKEDVGFVGIEDCADGLGINVEFTVRRHNTSAAVLINSVQSVDAQITVTSSLNDFGFTAAQLQEAAIVVDLSPSMKPTIMPSMMPTQKPTLEPTALNTPSAAPSQKVLTATVVQAIQGVSVADTISDSFVTTIQSTVAKLLNVAAANVVFNGVTPTADKAGVNVEYKVTASWTNRGYIQDTLASEENMAAFTAALQGAGFTAANVAQPTTTDVSPTFAPSYRPGTPTPAPTKSVGCDSYTVVQFLQRFDGVNAAQAGTADFQKQVAKGVAAGTGLSETSVVVVSTKASRYGEAVDFVYQVMGPVDTTADALTNLVKGAAVTDTVLENLRNAAGFPTVTASADAIPTSLC